MAFQLQSRTAQQPHSEMNLLPLIDVMLVLLVIFMVTAPLLTQGIKLQLPKASGVTVSAPAQRIAVRISREGQVQINGQITDLPLLESAFLSAAGKTDSEVRVEADAETAYQSIARVMGAAGKAGLNHIVFVTLPLQAS